MANPSLAWSYYLCRPHPKTMEHPFDVLTPEEAVRVDAELLWTQQCNLQNIVLRHKSFETSVVDLEEFIAS